MEIIGGQRRLTCTKQKDAEPPGCVSFRDEVVTLPAPWLDDDGTPVTSLVLRPAAPVATAERGALTGANRIAMEALKGLAAASRDG